MTVARLRNVAIKRTDANGDEDEDLFKGRLVRPPGRGMLSNFLCGQPPTSCTVFPSAATLGHLRLLASSEPPFSARQKSDRGSDGLLDGVGAAVGGTVRPRPALKISLSRVPFPPERFLFPTATDDLPRVSLVYVKFSCKWVFLFILIAS